MTTKEVLVKAKGLIDTPGKWCHGYRSYPDLDKICMVHALDKVSRQGCYAANPDTELAANLLVAASGAKPGCLGIWNDAHTHPEVMAAFDAAIAACDEQEGATV